MEGFAVDFFKQHLFRGFMLLNLVLVMIFTIIYKLVSMGDDKAFSSPLDFMDALYFAVVTQSTVGYGDISPKSKTSKSCVMLHITLVIALTVNFAIR